MAVKYIKKNGKIVAQEWTEDKTSNYIITGIVFLAFIATGIAYVKYRGELE